MKKKRELQRDKPFKKAHHYKNIEEAKADAAPGQTISDTHAQARMDAQDTAEKIKKEKDY